MNDSHTSPINKLSMNNTIDFPRKKKFGHRIKKLVDKQKEKKRIKKEKKMTGKGIKLSRI